MKHYRLVLTVAAAALMASGLTVAGDIYKWTDDDGYLHYEDRHTGNPETKRLDIESKNTDNSAVQASLVASREDRDAARQVTSEAPPEMTKAEIRAEQKNRQAQCRSYRVRLEDFLRSQRLYQEDDAGDRHYLSEDELIAARSRVREQIQEYCGSS